MSGSGNPYGRRDYGERPGERRRSASPRRDRNRNYREDRSRPGPNPRSLSAEVKSVEVPATGRLFETEMSPMQGTDGRRTVVHVNHYVIQSLPTVKTWQYELRMKVPASSQRGGSEDLRDAQVKSCMSTPAVRNFFGENFVFDGVTLLWSPNLIVPVGETRTTTVDMPNHSTDKPNQFEVSVRSVGGLNIKELVDYMRKGDIDLDPMGNEAIEPHLKWLNAVFRQDPASRWVTKPNSSAYFDRTTETAMTLRSTGDVLEAIRGVFQSVQIRFGKLTLNVDTATTAFWVPGKNLVEMLHALTGVSTRDNIERVFLKNPGQFMDACARIVGIFFTVRHLSEHGNAKKKKLTKWSRKDAIDTVFELADKNSGASSKTSVSDYFLKKYSIKLKYPRLPLAETKDGQIPLELCFSAAGERFKEPLQGAETADFIKFATAPAYTRKDQIAKNVDKLHWDELDLPKAMGLSVKRNMLQVPGKILASPVPRYASGTDRAPPDSGRWNLRNKKLLQPRPIKSWGMLYFPALRGLDDYALDEFQRAIQSTFYSLGFNMPSALPATLRGNPQGDVRQMMTDLELKARSIYGKPLELVLFLLHGASTILYKVIKSICDTDIGIASQVMLVDKALNKRGQTQYLANIALKVNVKLGGVNSTIQEPIFQKNRWMMLGADTSHPSPGQLRMNPPPPSFSALCASYDRECCAYTATASAQDAKSQIIEDFAPMFKELAKRYLSKNDGRSPDSILYYRDGLSESQFAHILETEVKPLKELCQYLKPPPKVTVVVCVKRHHTRMFPTERGDKLGNVVPGTVIENSPKNDIFLVAHPGLQGTVRPTRYTVLLDENNLSANDFQRITNGICYSYARATTAVSIVPPVYYADQACERARIHLRDAPEGGALMLPEIHPNLKFGMYWQ